MSDPGEVGSAFRVAGTTRHWEEHLSDEGAGKRERQSQGGWRKENPVE